MQELIYIFQFSHIFDGPHNILLFNIKCVLNGCIDLSVSYLWNQIITSQYEWAKERMANVYLKHNTQHTIHINIYINVILWI